LQPLLSIITVTKNCASTIERTLKSVEEIKSSETQYVVIDGKSDDGTLDIISRYKHVVDVLVSENDKGIYDAMNKGAEVAQGKYILFLNGDDYLLADGFNKAKLVLASESPEILSCQSEAFAENGLPESVLRPRPWHLFFFNTIPHLSTFVAAELQRKFKFRDQFRIAADYDLFLRLFLKGHHFTLSSLVTAVHFRGGFSNNVARSLAEMSQIRRENLGTVLYLLTSGIHKLNTWRKSITSTKSIGK
jgi:glycosyltransferase involved in cell wall biosynthesis